MKKEFSITGMHCQSCVTLAEKALNRLEGVNNAVVNLTTEKATVDFDAKRLNEKDIIKTILNKGYV